MNPPPGRIRIGTRGSKLALWQANWVKSALESVDPRLCVELVIIKTKGDKIRDVPLAEVGGKGLFVKEIETAILENRIDIAVHSLKDMPADIPAGLQIGAIPERENPADVLISKNGQTLAELKPQACIGTSSLRRAAQLRFGRPDVCILPLRGNLDTRIRKLEAGEFDAVILAAAGVKRLGLENKITEYLDPDRMLPAVGQGALCIEIRSDDSENLQLISGLDHNSTRLAVSGERAFLNRLEGGCQVPIAAYGQVIHDRFILSGLVAEVDGSKQIKDSLTGSPADCEGIGIALAERLLDMGAAQILNKLTSNHIG
ncbi:MAG: hydroxymethylbilane synthase [Desulfobacterales bacterium]